MTMGSVVDGLHPVVHGIRSSLTVEYTKVQPIRLREVYSPMAGLENAKIPVVFSGPATLVEWQ